VHFLTNNCTNMQYIRKFQLNLSVNNRGDFKFGIGLTLDIFDFTSHHLSVCSAYWFPSLFRILVTFITESKGWKLQKIYLIIQ